MIYSDSGERPRSLTLLSFDDLMKLPHPTWLVDGVIECDSFNVLYGPPSAGKSFLALDLSLSVATGSPWHGRDVQRGPVIYIVGEGGQGITRRIQAWLKHHGLASVDDAHFLLEAVQIREGNERHALLSSISSVLGTVKPVLIVLDTLARCFVGGDEDKARDMGAFIAGVDKVRQKTHAAVVTVHHTLKKNGSIERGSTALSGAADSMMLVKRRTKDKSIIDLHTTKQKDHEISEDIAVTLQPVDLGFSEQGCPLTSCVIVRADQATNRAAAQTLSSKERAVLLALMSLPGSSGRSGVWRDQANEANSTFDRCRKKLLKLGLVIRRGSVYYLTEPGKARATAVRDSQKSTPPTGTPARFSSAETWMPLLLPPPPP